MNIQKMMKQAQQMQSKMAEMQDKLAEEETEGSSGGGMVKVTLNGKSDMKKIHIDDSLVDPAEKEMLEDLIVAAFNDARQKVDEMATAKMGELTSGMGLPAGMKLPF